MKNLFIITILALLVGCSKQKTSVEFSKDKYYVTQAGALFATDESYIYVFISPTLKDGTAEIWQRQDNGKQYMRTLDTFLNTNRVPMFIPR